MQLQKLILVSTFFFIFALISQAQNIIKIDKGYVKLYSSTGSYIRTITRDCISASSNEEYVVVITSNTDVKLFDIKGNFKKKITTDGKNVYISKDQIVVYTNKNNKTKIYNMKGNYLKTI